MLLDTPIAQIKRIGPAYIKRLHKLDIKEVQDLLFHFPSRYEDFSQMTSLGGHMRIGEKITVEGEIVEISERMTWGKRRMKIIEALIEDEHGTIRAIWFNQPYLVDALEAGTQVLLSGKVTLDKKGPLLSSPIYEVKKPGIDPVHTARLVPVYPETRGVSSRWFRYIIEGLMPLVEKLEDPLPPSIRRAKKLPDIQKAIRDIHFPSTLQKAAAAKKRFSFEQLFTIQLAALRKKRAIQKKRAPKIKTGIDLTKKFVDSLPWKLTDSQRVASWQILKDMEKAMPMNRLLEGDVGSGKTIVAAIAALNVMARGWQTVFMAPTEILAEQHFYTFKNLLAGHGSAPILYTRTHKNESVHDAPLIIGTHALIQDKVSIDKLGLVVIDEQHRFGVQQRATLLKKKSKHTPHLLTMTATPIPRTLALTVYGDLDITLLREMPHGRKKIDTRIVPPGRRHDAYAFIQKELSKGHQAFVIFPLVEESEKIQLKAATSEFEKLSSGPFKNYSLGLLHGRMKSQEKNEVMQRFKRGGLDMLVSTSVVEVGIDIPNATVMMIEEADRFGLAQLHQFRGRVGRGEHQSYCFLLSESTSAGVLKRLRALKEAKDGFELAQYDLKFRGGGDLYGVRQSGMPDLAMESLSNIKLIEETRDAAQTLLEEDPTLKKHKVLQGRVKEMQNLMHFE